MTARWFKQIVTALVFSLASQAHANPFPKPEDMLWTSVGSAGVVNPQVATRIRMNGESAITTGSGASGQVYLRYNVTAVPGLSRDSLDNPVWGLRVRYRDNAGQFCQLPPLPPLCVPVSSAGIVLRLKRVSFATGKASTLVTLSTNSIYQGTFTQQSRCDTLKQFDFDFVKYGYYIEADFRPGESADPPLELHLLQIVDTGCDLEQPE